MTQPTTPDQIVLDQLAEAVCANDEHSSNARELLRWGGECICDAEADTCSCDPDRERDTAEAAVQATLAQAAATMAQAMATLIASRPA